MLDVVQKDVCRVFLWLYQGSPKYVGEYLDAIPGGKTGLLSKHKKKLKERNPPTNMDISLLYYLLRRTCGLAETDWKDEPSNSLEHTLYLIKEERNKLSHEGHEAEFREMSDAELEQKLNLLQSLCAKMLEEAAMRCGRLRETVKLIDNMEARLQEIQGVTPQRFVLRAREEMLKVARPNMADEWYQQPLLMLQSRPVGLDDLLQRKEADSFLLVSGEAGVGKSSLCR